MRVISSSQRRSDRAATIAEHAASVVIVTSPPGRYFAEQPVRLLSANVRRPADTPDDPGALSAHAPVKARAVHPTATARAFRSNRA